MKRNVMITLLLMLSLVAITTYIALNADFVGTDDLATETILSIDSHYVPWFTSFFEPSESGELFFFIFQGIAGSVVMAVCLHFYGKRGRRA
ncbi:MULTISPECIES: energy-coupling factor ABC transporter substrate-binding protein [unclassified Fusibacter]|uniref:energy-coupling factor ABC transporter substrate-binding protein n=1 Tax=unclassified Fusibacter TaxID=2624464 RepID=UPI00101246AB|nr:MULTISPECIES: energy-coupling factor ABC transporter substrate-binding protein [unclassified Fusibacter]MCK8060515.1 energy-coupling factor ABC transporter substrate-binding protein [Fusibacter sp. A2]NPE20196.1 hypothetical protein [Fusibacter sp. A1]RXV63406.1 hypothetical protein DWB64_00090 [Fusibacter sp. A1]